MRQVRSKSEEDLEKLGKVYGGLHYVPTTYLSSKVPSSVPPTYFTLLSGDGRRELAEGQSDRVRGTVNH